MAIQFISSACTKGAHTTCRSKACTCPHHHTLAAGRTVHVVDIENVFFNWEGQIMRQVDETHWGVMFLTGTTRLLLTFKDEALDPIP